MPRVLRRLVRRPFLCCCGVFMKPGRLDAVAAPRNRSSSTQAGQMGETCGACGASKAKANQDVWGFDDLYDLEKLSAQNGALASVTFQKRMPKHAAFAGNDVSACVESNFGLFTPSTRRCPCEYVCSMAWRLAKVHAI